MSSRLAISERDFTSPSLIHSLCIAIFNRGGGRLSLDAKIGRGF